MWARNPKCPEFQLTHVFRDLFDEEQNDMTAALVHCVSECFKMRLFVSVGCCVYRGVFNNGVFDGNLKKVEFRKTPTLTNVKQINKLVLG